MSRTETSVKLLKCLRCGHEWFPNKPEPPKVCPACHSPYWGIPRGLRAGKSGRRLNISEIVKKIEANKNKIAGYGVSEIGVFGSYARGEHGVNSDIDVLVSFDETAMDLYKFFDLKEFLEKLFKKKVDLVPKKNIKPALKESILRDVVYA